MPDFHEIFRVLLDSEQLIKYGGLALLLLIIFAETGLFFGFIFPGDALIFTAGILAGTKDLPVNIFLLLFSSTFAAFAGNMTGFVTGRIMGKRLFTRDDSLFFKKRHLEKARIFYEKYGGVSLVGGRFLPVVRTFVPIFAGAIEMNFWRFNYYNIAGAFLWIWTLIPTGYLLGKKIPRLAGNLEWVFLIITVIASTIVIRGFVKMNRQNKKNTR